MTHNGFGIGAVSSIETASGSALGKFRSSATEPKVSFIAHCTQCYVTRQLREYVKVKTEMVETLLPNPLQEIRCVREMKNIFIL